MRALALCVLAACGSSSMEVPDAADPDVDAPPGCTRPALDAVWLEPMLSQTIADLAAAPRANTNERNAARAYLTDQLVGMGWQARPAAYPSGADVFATIPATTGSEKEIIVGAHFDTVPGSPGANDNASGVAVVLAVARYLVDTPCRNAPVTVVLFDEEEEGLFGSRAFAGSRTPSLVRAVHTIDQVSWDSDGDHRFEIELPTAALEQEWRAAATVVGVPVTVTSSQGTDHEAFRDKGFAAVGLTEEYVGGDTSPFRHQAGDTPSTVNLPYLTLAAQLTAQVILEEVAP